MMNNWFIDPFKGPYTLKKKGIILFGVVLFVVLFLLEYTFGINHAHIFGSFFFSFNFPFYFTLSLLHFIRRDQGQLLNLVPWHRRPHILWGVLFLFISALTFTQVLNSFEDNNLPDTVIISMTMVSFLGMLSAIIRLIMVYLSKSE